MLIAHFVAQSSPEIRPRLDFAGDGNEFPIFRISNDVPDANDGCDKRKMQDQNNADRDG